MKLGIVGPVAPFISGIARHTTALANELHRRDHVDVFVHSFSRQYPAVLFRGGEQKSPDAPTPRGYPVAFDIDTLNPVSWVQAARRVVAKSPDMLVIPAWSFFVAPCLGTLARRVRAAGIPVSMIVHNPVDHEPAPWKTWLSKYQLRSADEYVVHNQGIANDLRLLNLDAPVSVSPHPVYDDYPAPVGSLPGEAGLELLFFGHVRPYKGLAVALRAVAESGLESVKLTIAGEFWGGLSEAESLIETLGIAEKVRIVPRHVTDQEAAELFARCDAVVTPYLTATGSGVVALAQHYERPVVASDIPGLSEAIADDETGWLFAPGDAAGLARLLRETVTRERAGLMRPTLAESRKAQGWGRFADALIARFEAQR